MLCSDDAAVVYLVIGIGRFRVCVLIEQDVCHHGREEKGQAASQSLYAGEAASRRTLEDGEPDVTVSQILLSLCPE